MKPFGPYIMVEIQDNEETTSAGIVIAGSKKDSMLLKGVVVGMGNWASNDVKVGDIVGLGKYSGIRVETDKKYAVIKQDDIVVTYED